MKHTQGYAAVKDKREGSCAGEGCIVHRGFIEGWIGIHKCLENKVEREKRLYCMRLVYMSLN